MGIAKRSVPGSIREETNNEANGDAGPNAVFDSTPTSYGLEGSVTSVAGEISGGYQDSPRSPQRKDI